MKFIGELCSIDRVLGECEHFKQELREVGLVDIQNHPLDQRGTTLRRVDILPVRDLHVVVKFPLYISLQRCA